MTEFRVSKNSWHYRFMSFVGTEMTEMDHFKSIEKKAVSFCTYWRMLVYRMIVAVCMAVLPVGLIGLMGWFLFAYPQASFRALGLIIFGVTFASSVMFVKNKIQAKAEQSKHTSRPQSIFMCKIKTMKEKICPPIVFERD